MKTITSVEFLQIPFSERLRYITTQNISADGIISGNVEEIEINFSFDRTLNRQLYLQTTAGMILPDQVRSVIVDGRLYERPSYARKGEFFDALGKRLIIRDETKIRIHTLVPSEVL